MKGMSTRANPYEAPAGVDLAVREVPWAPFLTAGVGLSVFTVLLATARVDPGLGVVAALGLAFVALGVVARRRRRSLVVEGSHVRVVRSGRAEGAPLELSAIQVAGHHPGITGAYVLLMLGIVSSSCRALSAHSASTHGLDVERMTEAFTGPFVGALCLVAVVRRLLCKKVTIPGERSALWIHEDHATRLGIVERGDA